MSKWNSSPHPISDLKDWKEIGRLEINPVFQRGEVWSEAARVMLIDSILNEIPLPKILVSKKIKGGSTHRIIIDGQQRTKTILAFLNDEFILKSPYTGVKVGQKFSDFTPLEQDKFLSYQIDFNESQGLTDIELRDVYSRLNKYTFALNKQELRRADFPGDFLNLSQDIASNEDLEDFRIFTAVNRRRLNDIEYISELLTAFIDGPQDKKNNLDDFYLRYTIWESEEKDNVEQRMLNTFGLINQIFNDSFPIGKTRFKQKSDFYSMMIILDQFLSGGFNIAASELQSLRDDLKIMHDNVSPSSDVSFLNLYAEKCLASANTLASRKWRINFMQSILVTSFKDEGLSLSQQKIYISILSELHLSDASFSLPKCRVCAETNEGEGSNLYVAWNSQERQHLSNAYWVHKNCIQDDDYCILDDNAYDIPDNIKELASLV